MSTSARLAGVPLLSEPTVRWEVRAGTKPYEATFGVRPEDAATLLNSPPKPVTLEINDGNRVARFQNLYVLAEQPAPHPHVVHVLVVDRRWFWSHTHVSRAFNVRRVVGTKRRRSAGGVPETDPLTPEIRYHPISLKNRQPWTAQQALESVLGQVVLPESKATGEIATWQIDPSIGSGLRDLPIEDVELEDAGDAALARMLAYLPEADVKLTADGRVVVYRKVDGGDVPLAREVGPEIVGYGHVSLLSNARLRPSKIHVLFTREHELRFDFAETGEIPTTAGDDERTFDNVLPVPDFSLVLPSGDTVDQGTWVSFPVAFRAWGAPPRQPHLSSGSAWLRALRLLMVPHNDLWTGIGLSGVLDPRADWVSRIGAIQQHWRRTWRISPRWMARIAQLRASLVATVDPTTGTRAPARVYADYARTATMRSLWKDRLSDDEMAYAMNFDSSPGSATAPLSALRPAPAELSIADADQGIVHFDFVPDPYRIYESALPGKVVLDGQGRAGATADIEDITRPIAYNALADSHSPPTLAENYRCAILLTAVPGNPNSAFSPHLYRVTVEPTDVMGLLPPSQRGGLLSSSGPELEIRVQPTIETARVAWSDEDASAIEKSFGLGDVQSVPLEVDQLVVNLEDDSHGGGSLKAIARGLAARAWAALTDRHHGEKGVPIDAGLEPAGWVEAVSHEVTVRGAAVSTIRWPDKLREVDMFSLLPENTRRLVLRLAPSPGKVNA